MNKHLLHSVLVGLIMALLVFSPALGFENPRESPPGTSAQTGLTASPDGTKFGIGTYNFLERFNLALGSLFQGVSIMPKSEGALDINDGVAGASDIVVQGRYAYLALDADALGEPSLRIIDVSNPANPTSISALTLPNRARSIAVAGKYAYMVFNSATASQRFRIIDVSNPASPQAIFSGSITGVPTAVPRKVTIVGRYAYVIFDANSADAFRVIDISDPADPEVVAGSAITLSSNPVDMYVSGNYIYLTMNYSGNTHFAVIDLSDPTNPLEKAEVGVIGGNTIGFLSVFASGRFAYISSENGLHIVDITDPTTPWQISTVSVGGGANQLPEPPRRMFSTGRYLYITTRQNTATNQLRILDVQNSVSPLIIGGAGFASGLAAGFPISMFISGRYVYFAGKNSSGNGEGFRAIDISGVESVSYLAHALEAGSLRVLTNAIVNNFLQVRGGITVGGSAFFGGGEPPFDEKRVTVRGNLRVTGSFSSEGGKEFLIDHPIDPLGKTLAHSAVESPEMKNIYSGTTVLNSGGEAAVPLPNYFKSLNRNFRYQLSPVDGTAMPNLYIAGEVKNNSFRIAGGRSFGTVSWQVTGIRNDAWARANPLKVEEYKLTQ